MVLIVFDAHNLVHECGADATRENRQDNSPVPVAEEQEIPPEVRLRRSERLRLAMFVDVYASCLLLKGQPSFRKACGALRL